MLISFDWKLISRHFRANSSLIRKPVPASSKTRVRSRSPRPAISCRTSLALSNGQKLLPFRALPHQSNRIVLADFMSDSMVEKDAHDISDLRAA
jgi:hypothetical protein